MAVRYKHLKVHCATCPKPPVKRKSNPTPEPTTSLTFDEQQSMRLWKHVLFGTGTCLAMIEGYARMEMPGDPLEAITQLRDRLDVVIHMVAAQQSRDLSVAHGGKTAQAREAALSAGVTEDQWAQFLDEAGTPPGCYEKSCWWLKKVVKTFGSVVGEAVTVALLDDMGRVK